MANIIRLGGGSGGSSPTLITKNITANGTYNASSDGADGYSSVIVNVSGGAQTLGTYSGKIYQDGTIVNDPDYVYTDEFLCPAGVFVMDFGTTAANNYVGLRMYDNGTPYEYWNATQRYRELDNTSYYRTGATARLSIPLAYLNSALLLDYAGGKLYASATPTQIVNT